METIRVEPLDGGWSVRTDIAANDMIFRSGHDAETSARALAERLARQGETVRLQLRLRNSGKTVRMIALPPLTDAEAVRLVELPSPIDPTRSDMAQDPRR